MSAAAIPLTDQMRDDADNYRVQMRKGVLEFATLLAISRKERYASEILDELKKADLIVVEGTLYPLLSRLNSAGVLKYTWEESPGGPPRKYYALTAKGKVALAQLTDAWRTLSDSIASLL
jgi:PadR family transcriptional regulator PadR